jgi:hypothetical protein
MKGNIALLAAAIAALIAVNGANAARADSKVP